MFRLSLYIKLKNDIINKLVNALASILLGERRCSVLLIRLTMVALLGSNNFCQTKCGNSGNTLFSCSSSGFAFHSSFTVGSFTKIVA